MTEQVATVAARLVGWIIRERLYAPPGAGGAILFQVWGEDWPAAVVPDVCVPIYERPDGRYCDRGGGVPRDGSSGYPRCPDCGDPRAVLVWAEGGFLPGTRQCPSCGSLFADSRYSGAGGGHRCDRHPKGV